MPESQVDWRCMHSVSDSSSRGAGGSGFQVRGDYETELMLAEKLLMMFRRRGKCCQVLAAQKALHQQHKQHHSTHTTDAAVHYESTTTRNRL